MAKYRLFVPEQKLLNDLRDNSCADRTSTFADGKP
jgi:hypothetical protein